MTEGSKSALQQQVGVEYNLGCKNHSKLMEL